MNLRDWTACTDLDQKVKIQDFDGNTLLVASGMEVAEMVIRLIETLDNLQPAILDHLSIEPKE
jgi:hypothetical protein